MEAISKEIVSNEQIAQTFENLKYDPLECSEDSLFDNSNDLDLQSFKKNIHSLNTHDILVDDL